MAEMANFGPLDGLHTFPRLLLNHAKNRPHAPAMREKHLGIWQTWTWSDVAERWPAASPSSVSSAATTARTST